jgi:hypothetical protein
VWLCLVLSAFTLNVRLYICSELQHVDDLFSILCSCFDLSEESGLPF